ISHLGLMLPGVLDAQGQGGDRIVSTAALAERAGFDGVYVGDHILHPRAMLESIVSLSFAAAVTTRVSVGPCVMLVALRRTAVLAKQLATLDVLSHGRLRLGIGVGGEYPEEWQASGVPTDRRGALTDQVVTQLRELLDGRRGVVGGPELEA